MGKGGRGRREASSEWLLVLPRVVLPGLPWGQWQGHGRVRVITVRVRVRAGGRGRLMVAFAGGNSGLHTLFAIAGSFR